MDTLFEKTALIVQKTEELDPEDRVSVEYEVIFLIDDPDPEKHTTFALHTDDKLMYEKFVTGKKTDLKFLESKDMKEITEITKKRAN